MKPLNKTTKRLLTVLCLLPQQQHLFWAFCCLTGISQLMILLLNLKPSRSKLKQRGIKFGSVSVGRLGQIEIARLQRRSRRPLGKLIWPVSKGELSFSSLLSGAGKDDSLT